MNFQRTQLLLGDDFLQYAQKVRIILFGVGGVGSWCAESLVRSGITNLTIVDDDVISPTNINRQLMATSSTIGQPKVEVMRQRLLDINPEASITTLRERYTPGSAEKFNLQEYDYIIDCIDSLKDKLHLILYANSLPAREDAVEPIYPVFFSSMGAALHIDPTAVRVADFWKVRNDPFGALLRKRLRQAKSFPKRHFLCVYSEELPLENLGEADETCSYKAVINGSLAHITGIFGFTLAGLVLEDISNKLKSINK